MNRKHLVISIILATLPLQALAQWRQTEVVLTEEIEQPLLLEGSATTFDDLKFPVSKLLIGPTKAPALVADPPGLALEFSNEILANEEEVSVRPQFPHTYKEGSDVYPHIHYEVVGGSIGQTIRFCVEFTWANVNEAWPTTTTLCGEKTITADEYTNHSVLSLGTMDGAGKTISSMQKSRLYRNSSADSFTGNVLLQEYDIHFELDGFGSRSEFAK